MVSNADDVASPVFSMEQQWHMPTEWSQVTNNGAIYAGTHGRGVFRSDTYLGTGDVPFEEAVSQRTLLAFPNPVEGDAFTLKLGQGWMQPTVRLYDINGRPVRTVSPQATAGGQVQIAVGDIAPGLYIVTATEGDNTESTRVIIR